MAKYGKNYEKNCIHCGYSFLGTRGQKYCGDQCYTATYVSVRPYNLDISTGTIGAIGELRVGVDLMARGYEVFRALSPAASCDLLVIKDAHFMKVEVRTAKRNANGEIVYPKNRIRADYIALVLPQEIVYQPELPQ